MTGEGKAQRDSMNLKTLMKSALLVSQPTRHLEITTACGCPNDCRVCPQQAFKSAYKGKLRLSYEDFEAVLSRLPKDVTLIFSGFSEPFVNSDCIKMVELASRQGRKTIINTTLVGATMQDIDRLARCRVYAINLHLPDNLGNTRIGAGKEYPEVLVHALRTLEISSFISMNRASSTTEGRG